MNLKPKLAGVHVSRNGVAWQRHNRGYPVGRVPATKIALLSTPEKMPGPSWSLPAVQACPYALFGEGTTCGGCYADGRGGYRNRTVLAAQRARYEWTRQLMKTPQGQIEWCKIMRNAIDNTGQGWFRIHDSGDFFSPVYVMAWYRVAASLQDVRFWAPTHSWPAPWVEYLVRLNSLPNVVVRPSALRIGDEPPFVPGLAAGTTVVSDGYTCNAPSNDGRCGDCRVCWMEPTTDVSYHLLRPHGGRIGGMRPAGRQEIVLVS
jgi:hypothetical protein